MYELLYTSIANKDFSKLELEELTNTTKKNNENKNITGLLAYNSREFMHIIEGEEDAVKTLFEKIEKDPRHNSVRIFYEGQINSRAFKNWAMALQIINPNEKNLLTKLRNTEDEVRTSRDIIPSNPNIGKNLFLTLRENL